VAAPPSRRTVACYRAIARLAPKRTRARVADEQVALFAEIWRDERPPRQPAALLWTIGLFGGALAAALRLHLDDWRVARPQRRRARPPLMNDFRHARRSLRRAPWYAATMTGVIAMGIALTATVFAVVDGVLFKPLPYNAPHELVSIQGRGGGEAVAGSSVSLRDVRIWRDAVPDVIFTAHSMTIGYGTLDVINGPTVWARAVDRDFWDAIGVRPLVGGFEAADFDAAPPTRPVVITHGLWRRVYGGDPGVIGRVLQSGRLTFRVVGVLPASFVFPTGEGHVRPDMLFPAVRESGEPSDYRQYDVIARIPSHLSPDAVRVRLEAATRRALPAAEAGTDRQRPFDAVAVTPLKHVMTADARPAAALIFAAMTTLVLLVAVNVGGLAGSRSLDRAREAAARRALGATSVDLARLQLLEIGLLVAAGAMAGVIVARYLLIVTAWYLPAEIMLLRDPSIDVRVIAAVLASAFAVAVTATVTGLKTSHRASLTSLLGQGAGADAGRSRSLGRSAFLAGQVALAMLLVVGGVLLTASLRNVWRVDTGYDLAGTIFVDVRIARGPSTTALARSLELLPILRSVPGVSSAGVIDTILLAGARRGAPFQPPSNAPDDAEMIPVSSSFFQIAGIRPIEGRLPTDSELDAGVPLAVVSERVARVYWRGSPAVGQTLKGPRATLQVVGVVKDARFQKLDQASGGEIYVPIVLGLWTSPAPTYLIRTTLPERVIVPALLEAVRRFDPASSLRRAQPVGAALAGTVKRRHFNAWLFGVMAVAGLLVAAAGIFGLVAAATLRRTREMGVRLALGSTREQLLRLLLREQLAPVLAGVAAGGLVAAWAVRFVRALLFELSAYDPFVWAAAAGVVIVVAAAGTLVPASRLTRVDPVRALRAD
jgi:putative ABC transport system permease protein